ncbi:MAG: ATP-binding protein, partial [Limisphaerales bacterium]
IRMLATAYSDIEAAIAAVNSGAIYKYIHKPWDVPQLEITLKRALEFYSVQVERDHLLHEKLSVLQNMMITDRVISLGLLAAGISHQVRNSLVAVRTFLDLAPAKLREENINLEALRNPNYWQDFYQQVQSQVGRLMKLMSDVGAVSELPTPAFRDRVQLDAVLSQALARVQNDLDVRSIRVENNVGNSLPELTVDAPKFQRIFELLLKSEAASLPTGSALSLRAEVVAGNSIKLEVRDNGPGLSQEALRSVFNPFYHRTEQAHEVGLNLMTCFFLAYHHGGSISVRNGEGTVFELFLPILPVEQPAPGQDKEFVSRVLANEELWEKLLSGE